jgi:tetratricopeptide (TPR) repeat protein
MGLWRLADSYCRTGALDRGVEHLVWLTRRPDCPASLLLKAAQSLDRLGEENAALEAYGEATRRLPDSAPAHFGLARIRARLGLAAELFLAPLARASALAPADLFYRASLHAAQVALGDADGARRSLLRIRIDEVQNPQVASSFARALDQAGESAYAGAWWVRAILLSGGRPA